MPSTACVVTEVTPDFVARRMAGDGDHFAAALRFVRRYNDHGRDDLESTSVLQEFSRAAERRCHINHRVFTLTPQRVEVGVQEYC